MSRKIYKKACSPFFWEYDLKQMRPLRYSGGIQYAFVYKLDKS